MRTTNRWLRYTLKTFISFCTFFVNKLERVEQLRLRISSLEEERSQILKRNQLLVDETYRLRSELSSLKAESKYHG